MMLPQIKTMAKLELRNLFGWNVLRHTKDPKARRKAILMAAVYEFLIVVVIGYVGGLSYGLILLDAAEAVPAYLMAIASLVLFFFGILKAGGVLFNRNGYDILCSLPVSQAAIVGSRFLRMYVEDLALSLAVLLPGFSVYAWFLRPDAGFYLTGLLAILCVPLLPIAGTALIGAVVTGISSRMKHKSLVEAGLTIVIVLAVLGSTPWLAEMEGTITPEMLKELSATVLDLLEKLYPPAVWMGAAVVGGDMLQGLACAGLFLIIFAVVIALVSVNFHSICRKLYSSSAKHDYQMGRLKTSSALLALYQREWKRYFASGTYVSNTIIGPIMGTVLAAALFFVGTETILQTMPIPLDLCSLVPFALASVFCLMTTTSTSISMEGKNWWIVKTLPLETKTILDAKLLMNLSLILPFYLVSEVLLMLALKPGMTDMIWMLVIPAILILFSCIYGLTINLCLPVLNWESEVSVVKQGASSVFGGMGGFLLALLCIIPIMLVPDSYLNLAKAVICMVLLGITALLYHKNNHWDLQAIH